MAYGRSSHHLPGLNRRDLTVYMFQEDVNKIESWVLRHPNQETGGDLFGLWTAADGRKHEPVMHVVLGPGSGCRRTSTSFFQSIPYLKNVGYLLTQKYMLGHIGEWHSHHQIGLFQPSAGDSGTILRNFPCGAYGFILIIVNIISSSEVKISPFLYSEQSRSYQLGRVEVLAGESPFRKKPDVLRAIENGAEPEGVTASRIFHSQPRAAKRHREPEVPMDIDTFEYGDATTSRSVNQERSSIDAAWTTANNAVNTERSPLLRRGTLERPNLSPNRQNATRYPVLDESKELSEARVCTRSEQWYSTAEGEKKLHKIYQSLQGIADDTNVEIERSKQAQDVSMHFKHHQSLWRVEFPRDFPESDIRLKREGYECLVETGGASERKDLISKIQDTLRRCCVKCRMERTRSTSPLLRRETVPRQNLSPARQSDTQHRVLDEPNDLIDARECTNSEQWYKTQKGLKKLKKIYQSLQSIADGKSVEMERSKQIEDLSMHFKHHKSMWCVEFPRDFPKSGVRLTGEGCNYLVKAGQDLIHEIKDKLGRHVECRRIKRTKSIGTRGKVGCLPNLKTFRRPSSTRKGDNVSESKPRWR